MDFGQRVRLGLSGLRRAVTPQPKTDPFAGATADVPPAAAMAETPGARPGRWKLWAGLGLASLIPIYFMAGSILTHRINDDLTWKAPDPGVGASKTVAVIAGLIDREVNETAWAPNTQPFQPAALLRFGGNMVNFQAGLVKGLAAIVLELESRVARMRGTSAADVDMGVARQGLSRQPDTWLLDPLPTSSADQEYRKALRALLNYNQRLAAGQAVFDVRADNLQALLDRAALDLGGASDALDRQVEAGRKVLIDRRADKIFYFSKGQSYAYFIVLKALREDFKDVLAERRVTKLYDAMLEDLALAAALQPAIVQNASPAALTGPNHLTTQGFYVLRARARLREITDVLQR
jgi:hypothetical protein